MEFSSIISQVSFCKFSPNSVFFIYLQGKKLYIKDSSVSLSNFQIITLTSTPSQIIISPDSQLIAILYKEKAIVQIYSPRGQLVAKIQDNQAGFSGILWCPDSLQIVCYSELLYKCSIYNLANKSIAYIKSPKLSTSKGCIFSSNGKFMALLQRHECKDVISIYFTGDWKMVNSIVLESFDVIEIKWDQNDSHIVAWENCINYKLHVICPFKGVISKISAYDYALGIKSVQFSKTSAFLAIGSYDQKIRIFNAKTWKLIAQLDCSSPVINNQNTKIYKEEEGQKGTSMRLVDKNQYKIPIVKPVSNGDKTPTVGVGLLQFSQDDMYLACRNDNMPFTVWIWNLRSLQIQVIMSLSSNVRMMKWDKQQDTLVIASGADKLTFWKNRSILECGIQFVNRSFNVQRFIWSNDNKRMLLFDKNQVIYADLIKQNNKQ